MLGPCPSSGLFERDLPGILGTVYIDKIVMKITKHRISAKPKRKGDVPPRLSRLFFLWGGIFALIVFAVLVGSRWDPGLADFLFWLIAIWMVLIRYVEIWHFGTETQLVHPKPIRQWHRYSVRVLLVAGLLYALARIVAHRGLI